MSSERKSVQVIRRENLFLLWVLLLVASLPRHAHSFPADQPARSHRHTVPASHVRPVKNPAPSLPAFRLVSVTPSPDDLRRPPGMLDPVGRLAVQLPAQLTDAWKRRLKSPSLGNSEATRLHLLLGEWQLAQNQQPLPALAEFDAALRCAPAGSREQGAAAFDRCLALFNAGEYPRSLSAFLHLLHNRHFRGGFDRRNAAMWLRHVAVCVGYHAERAKMGIPEPIRLDPLCGAAALAACLRAQHLPFDKRLVLAHIHATGQGSSLQDVLDAAHKLGMAAHALRADDAGLRLLTTGCVAHVEHDHFIAVVKADKRGVTYLCSDCGPWPGGEVRLNWKQWHALEPDAYAVIAKPGSRQEQNLQIALKGSEKVEGAARAKRDRALLKAHPELAKLILHLVALQDAMPSMAVCGYTNPSLHCPCYQEKACPKDSGGAATGDPVELATGEEAYMPSPDLSVYSPVGASVVWGRRYDSLRGWDPAYNADDFGLGWSHNFGGGFYIAHLSPCPQVTAGQGVTLPPTFADPPQRGSWDIVCNDRIVASSLAPNGWAAHYNGPGSGASTFGIAVTIPASAVAFAGYEVRLTGGPDAADSACFAIVAPGTVPRGLGSFAIPSLSGVDLPASGSWDVTYQGTVIANSTHPRGWYMASTTIGTTITYLLSAPVTTTLGSGYEFRYRPQIINPNLNGANSGPGPSAPHFQTLIATSTPFTIVDSRLYPFQWIGIYQAEVVEPGGGHIPVFFNSMPSAILPSVQATLVGAPMIVTWNYDPHNPLGSYSVKFSDHTSWVIGACNKVIINTLTGAYVTQNGAPVLSTTRVFGACCPLTAKIDRNGYDIALVYGTPTDSGFPLLTAITDGTKPLLTLNHATDGTGALLSVTDRYGRSVYYHETRYGVGEIGPYPMPPYFLLDIVSQVTPTGTQNPPARFNYSYSNVANTITFNGETIPMLTSISVPSPTGVGTSTATITYAADTEYVTKIRDANGNTHSYQFFTQTVDPDGDNDLPGDKDLQVLNYNTVTCADSAGKTVATYRVRFDQQMREINHTNGDGVTVVQSIAYNDPNCSYRPSAILYGDGINNHPNWNYTYGFLGHVATATSPYGVTTTYTWDYSQWFTGELIQIQQGTRTPTTFTYEQPSGLPQTVTFARPGTVNSTATVTYNTQWTILGNLLSINAPGNNATNAAITTFNYDQDGAYSQDEAPGQPLTITDPLGKVTHLRYYNNALNASDPLANTGQLKSVVDALGNETDFAYNLVGQTVKVTSPATGETGPGQASAQIAYQYPGGRVASSALYDESGVKVRSVSPVYGKEGELLTVTGSVLPVSTVYDALYRTVSLTDGRQNATHYTYSPGGYLASVTYPSGDLEQATGWDYDGNVLSASDGRGAIHTYQYNDPESHLTNVACVGAPSATPQYTYDTYGRLTQAADANGWRTFTYDDNDSLATLTNHFLGMPLAQTVLPSYYPDGSLQTLSSPAGALTYTYNARGELTGLTNPAHDVFAWSYLDNGWLASEQSGNAALTAFAYNAAGQLLEQHTTRVSTGAVLSDFAMAGAGGYDGAGDLLGQSATLPQSPGAYSGTSSYGYDGLGQLTQEVSNRQGNSTHTFAYDAAGNPTTFRSLVGLSYNTDNQPGNNYDRDGSPSTWQAQTLTFDDNDTLTAIGAQSQYGYSDGARVWKQTAAGRTYFLNVGGTPLCELDANGKVLASNTVGADGLCARTTASGSTFYSFDLQGGTALRLDAVGNVLGSYSHDAYGNRTSTDNSADPYSGYGAKWGYYRDTETGLSLLGARYYDASQGRFLNRDPIGYDGGSNLYSYAGNNPISHIDPSGHFWDLAGGGISSYDPVGELDRRAAQAAESNPPNIPNNNLDDDCNMVKDLADSDSLAARPQADDEVFPMHWSSKAIGMGGNLAAESIWFAGQVRTGGPWDFKQRVRGSNNKGVKQNYDNYGNFHYGATAAALGYSLEAALRAAGVAQMRDAANPKQYGYPWSGPPYGDDPHGQYWTRAGWYWYQSHHGGEGGFVSY